MQKIHMPKCTGGITWPKHVHAQSRFWAVKTDLSFLLYARVALANILLL